MPITLQELPLSSPPGSIRYIVGISLPSGFGGVLFANRLACLRSLVRLRLAAKAASFLGRRLAGYAITFSLWTC